jgi:hypothetical protein
MRQVDLAAAEHLLSPFFGVKLLYDYGFWCLPPFAGLTWAEKSLPSPEPV